MDVVAPTAVAPFEGDPTRTLWYVSRICREHDLKIPANRGVPPGAHPSQMLSIEEKAIVFMGVAVGATSTEIVHKINDERAARDETLISGGLNRLRRLTIRHKEIIAAIQADLLTQLEGISPLISGTARFMYRARLMELYRRAILSAAVAKGMSSEERLKKIAHYDKLMRPHMKWFDEIGDGSDLANKLRSPGEKMADEQFKEAERMIREERERGEIDEDEMMDKLRRLKDLTLA